MKLVSLTMSLSIMLLGALQVRAGSTVTIYNQNFAVVRDTLQLDLKEGSNEIQITDITAHLEPDSVILRDPASKRDIQILEQNYRADPVSENLLLALYEGQEISFVKDGKLIQGKIIRSGYVPHQSGLRGPGY